MQNSHHQNTETASFKEIGFTTLELLISVAIVIFLAAIIYSGISSFKESNILLITADTVADTLNKAKIRTLSSKLGSAYGVQLASTTITLFKGDSFVSGTVEETINLRAPAVIYSASLSLSSLDIVFKRLTGETDNFGTITLRSEKNNSMTKTITIYASGLVEIK